MKLRRQLRAAKAERDALRAEVERLCIRGEERQRGHHAEVQELLA